MYKNIIKEKVGNVQGQINVGDMVWKRLDAAIGSDGLDRVFPCKLIGIGERKDLFF